jgi:AraC-like DNA-binding protein
LSGYYEEFGDEGKVQGSPGIALFHDRYEGHLDRFLSPQVGVLNLPLDLQPTFSAGAAIVQDVDAVVRAAERDPIEAALMLIDTSTQIHIKATDWPEKVAGELITNPAMHLGEMARRYGLSPSSFTRGFKKTFGISPEAFRARVRVRAAWRSIRQTREPFAAIAARLGFSDQSHMTRTIRQLTGTTPTCTRKLSMQMDSRQRVSL